MRELKILFGYEMKKNFSAQADMGCTCVNIDRLHWTCCRFASWHRNCCGWTKAKFY